MHDLSTLKRRNEERYAELRREEDFRKREKARDKARKAARRAKRERGI